MRILRRYLREESGTALLASALLMVLLTGAGMAAVMTTSVNQNASKNVLTSKQAFYLADAGIQHAKTFLTQNQSNWTTYASAQATALPLSNTSLSTGGYSVTTQDGGNGSLLITSTGTAAGNAKAVVQSLVTYTGGTPPYTPGYAVLTGGSICWQQLTIDVNVQITGTSGGVHTNCNLFIKSSSPTISGNATASGTYTNTGTPTIGGISGGGTPTVQIPKIDPNDFYPFGAKYWDYYLSGDGNVYDRNGTVVVPSTGCGQGCVASYAAPSGTWTITGNTSGPPFPAAVLWAVGDLKITGDFGTNVWIATAIATGSITVTAKNINMRPPTSTDTFTSPLFYHPEAKDILLLARADIFITPPNNGTAQTFKGLLAAHEQISVKGLSTTTINGALVAEDATDTTGSAVSHDDYLTTGPAKIIYNGAADISNPTLKVGTGTGTVNIMTWQTR